MKARACELCNGEASLFCPSDSAFLCRKCDSRVHGANFLVARHVRRALCSDCGGFTGNRFSGAGVPPLRPLCRSCSPEFSGDDVDLDSLSSPCSSACISSTESSVTRQTKINFEQTASSIACTDLSGEQSDAPAEKAKKHRPGTPAIVDWKAESILTSWCGKLGVGESESGRVGRMACRALGVCLGELTVLPFRVSLASSLWWSLRFRFRGEGWASTWQILRRLEEVSGVPARLILVAESRLRRVLKMRRPRRQDHQQEEEGWAECSI